MNIGHVSLHRKIFNDPIIEHPTKFLIFTYLISKANHKTVNVGKKVFRRGEHITSHANIAKDLKLSKQTVYVGLKWLKDNDYIKTVHDTGTHVVVVNYEKYQNRPKI